VAQLVGHDVQRRTVRAAQAGLLHCLAQPSLQRSGSGAAPGADEHEVGEPSVPGVRQRPLGSAFGEPADQRGQGRFVERDGPFGVELAERGPQPAALRAVVEDAVQFEVEQLPDPQASAPHDL